MRKCSVTAGGCDPDKARVARGRGSRVADFGWGRGSRVAGLRPRATPPTLDTPCRPADACSVLAGAHQGIRPPDASTPGCPTRIDMACPSGIQNKAVSRNRSQKIERTSQMNNIPPHNRSHSPSLPLSLPPSLPPPPSLSRNSDLRSRTLLSLEELHAVLPASESGPLPCKL